MTRQQFNDLFSQLITEFDFPAFAEKTKQKVLASGAVNLPDWDAENDAYILPKAMLYAIFQECVFQTKPFSKDGQKAADKIKLFT